MDLKPVFKTQRQTFTTIDMHTVGEPARVIIGGIPELPAGTMMMKKEYFIDHYDYIRTSLCFEPRGHKDMLCVALVEPSSDKADFGVLFLESGGVVNMCGHGTIAAATAIVECGFVEVTEPYTTVTLDTPAGIIITKVKVENDHVISVDLENVPSFLYKENLVTEIEGYGKIIYDISFSGSFCAIVDSTQLNMKLSGQNVDAYTKLGMRMLEQMNKEVEVKHPLLNITSIDVIDFYGPSESGNADLKNIAIFGESQVDRSPCGTGISAKVAELHARKKLAIGEQFVYESIVESLFYCVIKKEAMVGDIPGVVPIITGSAYITGYNQWMIDESDPFKYGFILGK